MDTVAERILQLRVENDSLKVAVKLGRPELDESGENWKCQYEVSFGQERRYTYIHGLDSMQALQLAMTTLDAELERGAKMRGGELFHLDEPFVSILEAGGFGR
ncbi:MAG: hypothetical protein H6977_10345 [Gammaproteobacteria bacterium]|nr:hypothetical protein [Planctomycetales bacterium]MCP5200404.1 hypothetical protein [Gammaproteobacteria bacterium]